VGATVLLVIGYLLASWLGIPLDGLSSTGPNAGDAGPNAERPVAVATDNPAGNDLPAVTTNQAPRAATEAPATTTAASDVSQFKFENVTVRNLDGEVAFRGTVDLTATMQRIDAGQTLRQFRNDGTTFQNRERRLPIKERGYYKEYVHPTPKLGGPGPQRVVTGKQGEAYYTFDHYKTFQKVR